MPGFADSLPKQEDLLEVYKLASEAGRAAALSRFEGPLDVGLFSLGGNENGRLPHNADEKLVKEFRATRLAQQWQRITQQPAYKWLANRPEYVRARQIFEHKKAYRNSSLKLRADDADFKFVHAVVWSLMVFVQNSDPKNRRRLPSKRAAIATRGHLSKLLAADLGYLAIERNTRNALEALDRQLAEAATTRKTTEDRNYAQRRFVTCLAWWFSADLGDSLFTAVRELCALVGYQVSDAALHPQIKEARRRWTKQLAKGLRKSSESG